MPEAFGPRNWGHHASAALVLTTAKAQAAKMENGNFVIITVSLRKPSARASAKFAKRQQSRALESEQDVLNKNWSGGQTSCAVVSGLKNLARENGSHRYSWDNEVGLKNSNRLRERIATNRQGQDLDRKTSLNSPTTAFVGEQPVQVPRVHPAPTARYLALGP